MPRRLLTAADLMLILPWRNAPVVIRACPWIIGGGSESLGLRDN